MSWSYDETNLGTDTAAQRLNSVRSLLQDTDTSAQQLQDEEIAFYLSQTSDNVYLATAMAADTLSARYARYGDTSIDNGGISVDFTSVVEGYRILSTQMQKASKTYGAGGIGIPRAGGISRAAMADVYSETDRVDPAFRQRQFRNPPTLDSDDDDDRIR